MPARNQELRRALLERLPSSMENLDIKRVESFILGLGIPLGEVLVVDKENEELIKKIFAEFNLEYLYNSQRDRNGVYIPEIDLCIVLRDKGHESLNGPVYTEGFIVHELIHASSRPKFIKRGESQYVPRTGNAIRASVDTDTRFSFRGFFFEEGIAGYFQGEYIKQLSTEERGALLEKVGLARNTNLDMPSRYDFDGIHIPPNFLHLGPRGVELKKATMAAMGVKLIAEKEPSFIKIMLASRNDAVELKKIPQLLERLKPGLYNALQKLGDTADDFTKGYRLIKDSL